MTDDTLQRLMTAQLEAALAAGGVTNGTAKRTYQPTAAGPNRQPTLYFAIIADRRYGWPGRSYALVPTPGMMAQSQRQTYETTVQITALADEVQAGGTSAADLANLAAAWCAGDEFRAALRAEEAGVLRVSDVRRPFLQDERDENFSAPSFDVVITHRRVLQSPIHQIDRFGVGIRRV